MGYSVNDELEARMNRHSAESLQQEILLSKALLEERLSLCKNDAERALLFPAAIQAISTIEKMTHDLHRFNERTNQMLSRPTIEQLGRDLVDVIVRHVKPLPNSDELIDAIARDVSEVIGNVKNQPEE